MIHSLKVLHSASQEGSRIVSKQIRPAIAGVCLNKEGSISGNTKLVIESLRVLIIEDDKNDAVGEGQRGINHERRRSRLRYENNLTRLVATIDRALHDVVGHKQ